MKKTLTLVMAIVLMATVSHAGWFSEPTEPLPPSYQELQKVNNELEPKIQRLHRHEQGSPEMMREVLVIYKEAIEAAGYSADATVMEYYTHANAENYDYLMMAQQSGMNELLGAPLGIVADPQYRDIALDTGFVTEETLRVVQ
jgi:hypothetical protein